MKLAEMIVPFSLLAILMAVSAYGNLHCDLLFGRGSTSRLKFHFGWPLSYLDGDVPGPGRISGEGPNFVWGHPEMNRDTAAMEMVRQRWLSHLSLTPWDMRDYGRFHWTAAVANLLILTIAWPVTWLLYHSLKSDRQHKKRFASFTVGDRVRFCKGPFSKHVAMIEDINVEKSRITVSLHNGSQRIILHAEPEEIVKELST